MGTFKDLSDPALLAEFRKRAAEAEQRRREADQLVRDADLQIAQQRAERNLFARSIGDIQPLNHAPRSRSQAPKPPPQPRQREADEADALEASRIALYPSPMAWDVGLDIEVHQSHVRPGLNPDLLRRLRRGDWSVQGSLDLHSHTQDEARIALGEFLAAARRNGWRCVRIIHGKGLSSPNREPVLKSRVRKWLQMREEVLAYCEPRPNAGGSGAVVVLLAGNVGKS
jgi:DNA-nicking Smr family endonuclease